ncbi:hypothetical protein ACFFV7_30235 [Nonomuraea spiralis]|uniref:Metalloprotease n=1 Tax=Nonomuraea spiralis TaxID=46182 RepID=A0ABV5ILT3_9ACTN|nr:hypothetical protein [Nonomuraea spiralis]GGT26029.1 hypothetical protein GCM10010176_083330 [Nonomuraea spiralis]
MKRLSIILLACAAVLPVGGTANAAAYPVKNAKLTANPLYDTGTLPTVDCAEPPVRRGDRKLARAYLDSVIGCLESAWQWHLDKASLPYSKIKVRHLAKIPKNYCGFDIPKDDSQAQYCPKTRTLVFQIGKNWLDDPTDLWLFDTAAAMYAMHVQKLTGIYDAYLAAPHRSAAEQNEQERRQSLQAECLGGAFVKSAWPMTDRTDKDWTYFLSLVQGDGPHDKRTIGSTASLKKWISRGFATGDPASCNTWTAPSSAVA